MKYLLNILIVSLSIINLTACTDNSDKSETGDSTVIESVRVDEFKSHVDADEAILLDVRTPGEYQEGHIPGSKLMDINGPGFEDQLAALDKEKTYLVYCRSGNRSMQAANKMKEMGFEHVINLDGGILDWQQEGYEIE